MAKDYSKKMKESALIQQTEEYMDNEVFGEASASVGTQPVTGTKAELSGTVAGMAQPNSDANGGQRAGVGVGTPPDMARMGTPKSAVGAHAVAPMMTKGISVKLPYDIYDHLDAKKKMSQRTGNRADRKTLEEIIIDYLREGMENHPL